MATFQPGTPIETQDPLIEVTIDPQQPSLGPGRHRFRLVVVDNDGLSSAPDEVDVIIRDERVPTAVLEAPREVRFGQSFELSGRRSSDPAPGKVVRWIWTLMG